MATWLAVALSIVVYAVIGVIALTRMARAGYRWWGYGVLCGGWPVFIVLLGIQYFMELTDVNGRWAIYEWRRR